MRWAEVIIVSYAISIGERSIQPRTRYSPTIRANSLPFQSDASSLCLRQAAPRQPPERTQKRNIESPTVIPRVHRQLFGNRSKSEHLCDTFNLLYIVLLMYNLWDYIPCKIKVYHMHAAGARAHIGIPDFAYRWGPGMPAKDCDWPTPSHIPMIKRQANSAPKEWHVDWAHKATAQTKIFALCKTNIRLAVKYRSRTASYLVHLPTGKYCRAKIWGYWNTRNER